MKRPLNVLLAFCVMAGSAFAQSQTEIRFALDEPSVLPGVPTGFTVTFANTAGAPVHLPSLLWMIATTADGSRFNVPAVGLSTEGRPFAVPEEVRIIPARGSRELRFDVSPAIVGTMFLTDERIARPGTYRLQLVLADDMTPAGVFERGITSSEQLLTVAVGSKEDAGVWEWMQKHSDGSWGGRQWLDRARALTEFVQTNHPESDYALFTAFYLPMLTETEVSPLVAQLITKHPDHPFIDQLKLILLQSHSKTSTAAFQMKNLGKAGDESDAARAIAADLIRNTRSEHVRKQAESLLARTPTREQLAAGAMLR